jgi:hypothetical protein
MQERKFLQELTIGEGLVAPFVLAQSGGEAEGREAAENDEVCRSGNVLFGRESRVGTPCPRVTSANRERPRGHRVPAL